MGVIRPIWDIYFMALAKLASTRSHDPDTKHGAVMVDYKHRVMSMGYNGYPAGGGEEDYPDARPGKYLFMVHSEINAIVLNNSSRQPHTLYVTGFPCAACFHAVIQSGLQRVVLGDVNNDCVTDEHKKAVLTMARVHNVQLQYVDMEDVAGLFRQMLEVGRDG
jgi:dCMP deaminase